jgi:hypothetical protein
VTVGAGTPLKTCDQSRDVYVDVDVDFDGDGDGDVANER